MADSYAVNLDAATLADAGLLANLLELYIHDLSQTFPDIELGADGRFGYTGNGSGSVSGFGIAPDGAINLLDANGATAIIGGGVNDIALSGNSRFLYVLQIDNGPAIHAFRIQQDGRLEPLGPVGGLPVGTRGLAAR